VSKAAISVEGLGKMYRLSHKGRRPDSFREAITSAVLGPFRRLRELSGRDESLEEFWALKDVSFEVQPGEVVGIIGRNGAGKSTLLKVLSRIVEPTEGRAILRGRVASLLEVGTGFHPELSGRENIYLNGSILGMKKREIDSKFDEIVSFAEVEKFLDTPVKRYSSGMYVRLAFAVAAHLEPEILIVDEVLAVGDAEFQKKCLGKMQDVASGSGRTVLFVSHNILALASLCTRGVVLNRGRPFYDGPVQDAITAYSSLIGSGRTEVSRVVSSKVTWAGVQNHDALQSLESANDINIHLAFRIHESLPSGAELDVAIADDRGRIVIHLPSRLVSPALKFDPGDVNLRLYVRSPRLAPGSYSLSVYLKAGAEVVLWIDNVATLRILPLLDFGSGVALEDMQGVVLPQFNLVKVGAATSGTASPINVVSIDT
jgi:lipopolysaccharide transport system ATP-binding protein